MCCTAKVYYVKLQCIGLICKDTDRPVGNYKHRCDLSTTCKESGPTSVLPLCRCITSDPLKHQQKPKTSRVQSGYNNGAMLGTVVVQWGVQ